MNRITRAAITVPVVGLTALLASAGPAAAAEGSAQADLTPVPVNPVNASGRGEVEISGTTLSFSLAAQGLLAGAPHAAHIHFGESARNECPTASDNNAAPLPGESDPHEHFTTTEGAPAYGEIVVSLTTTGDTSPSSGLAVDRFPVGDHFEYSRGDVQVSEEVAQAILSGKAVVVIHGVDYDGDGTYSAGDRGVSDLDPSLPGEATDPALCGVLNASQVSTQPVGAVAAGDGSSSADGGSALPYVLGGLGLTAAGGAAFAARRSSRATA
ncbi:CHRD domain-containing protein [Geodermatophilus sp. DF01-2]|uniref:CHRD domain-containing protein n=1 Tax=Geodermatophilus sp. DF01-2 TaxID=2559610 RepID=UPI0010733B2B|nr:CHRD domain-containing protein [Geodermatophilus sp. DF01_2]TFV55474.1 CHRD domain-containing protein [Geodermatophilus sp. DF01_2]